MHAFKGYGRGANAIQDEADRLKRPIMLMALALSRRLAKLPRSLNLSQLYSDDDKAVIFLTVKGGG
jgi:hypothetical protein